MVWSVDSGVLACCRSVKSCRRSMWVRGVSLMLPRFQRTFVRRHGVDERRQLNSVPKWVILREPGDHLHGSTTPWNRLLRRPTQCLKQFTVVPSVAITLTLLLLVGVPRWLWRHTPFPQCHGAALSEARVVQQFFHVMVKLCSSVPFCETVVVS